MNADSLDVLDEARKYTAGENTFVYCYNSPLNYKDEDGTIAINILGAIIGAAAGLVGGYYLARWLANRIGLRGLKRKAFIGGLTALIGASAAAIGYFAAPYLARVWTSFSSNLAVLFRGAYKGIKFEESTSKWNHILKAGHLWKKVLGKNVTKKNVKNMIRRAIRNGKWTIDKKGVFRITWRYNGNTIEVTGSIVKGFFRVGDAWVRR